MVKGPYTQGFIILLKRLISIDDLILLLSNYELKSLDPHKIEFDDKQNKQLSEAQKDSMKKWINIGPSIFVKLQESDGRIHIDIVNNQ